MSFSQTDAAGAGAGAGAAPGAVGAVVVEDDVGAVGAVVVEDGVGEVPSTHASADVDPSAPDVVLPESQAVQSHLIVQPVL